ncbi:glutamate/tyrosine decarboxylase-like PLP-dependent enzyme [Actinokineospora baliensis]|uniref:pyridoxal phosphate-dependent decarboxylase family protein n=1 Tax=Actinokineospora baliensis TaxID=547056 RepID=UPI0019586EDF|nr:aspartate aminotransferase family protein [Actinokineospora baliensis]MBM7771008.1 glutamate/tyrosine decarboxylase-like PLP-dependent enzyme [Actinokineospora baliensis]
MDLPDVSLPDHGVPREELFADLRARKTADADWRGGRTWSLIYPAGADVDAVIQEANGLYLHENALNPFRFPSLADMEREVVAMTAGLLNAPAGASGSMTSGGTESIMQAIRVARDRARAERGVTAPTLVVPRSAHPAFAKGAKYFGLELVQIPLAADLRADVTAAADLIDDRTALVAGSAPNYPHGVVDPIPELAAIAAARGIPFHTDACVGGFLLPFMDDAPPFDFRIPGVTTISADLHKYGYATKGASVLLHRNGDHVLQYQAFLYQDWPGGLYGSLALAGARPAAPIATAWSVMRYLGTSGYTRLVGRILATAEKIRTGITSLGLTLLGDPVASVIAFTAPNIMSIGDRLDDQGWHLDRQNHPDALHLMVSPEHDRVVDQFLHDLREAVDNAGESRGVQARYS